MILRYNYHNLCVLFAIWYHLYNLKNVKNTLGGVLKLHSPTSVLHVYQIVQIVPNRAVSHFYTKKLLSLSFCETSISVFVTKTISLLALTQEETYDKTDNFINDRYSHIINFKI